MVTSAKQRRYPSPGHPTDSTNYRKCVLNFFSSWLANRQWPFYQANYDAYWNSGAQVGAKNKDFSVVWQTELTRSLVPFVAQVANCCLRLSVIVCESVPGAKSCGQPIWLKIGTEVGCDEIFQKPLWLISLTNSGGSHFLPFEHQKSSLLGGILKVW